MRFVVRLRPPNGQKEAFGWTGGRAPRWTPGVRRGWEGMDGLRVREGGAAHDENAQIGAGPTPANVRAKQFQTPGPAPPTARKAFGDISNVKGGGGGGLRSAGGPRAFGASLNGGGLTPAFGGGGGGGGLLQRSTSLGLAPQNAEAAGALPRVRARRDPREIEAERAEIQRLAEIYAEDGIEYMPSTSEGSGSGDNGSGGSRSLHGGDTFFISEMLARFGEGENALGGVGPFEPLHAELDPVSDFLHLDEDYQSLEVLEDSLELCAIDVPGVEGGT